MSPNENPNNAQPRQPQPRPAAQTQAQPAAQTQAQPAAQTQARPAAQTQAQPAAQTQPYPAAQTPTSPNAPYGPSPEPKLGERLNVQALVNFIKRPPVLVALLVVGAFCLGRCDGGDKNEVAQTESAVQTESVATAEPDYEKPATNATFLDEFNDVFHRFNERVLKKVNKDSAHL